jgi:hypothetical protein
VMDLKKEDYLKITKLLWLFVFFDFY